jgi:HD-GYP domain-containing protein (c-di-GMP phosphodiesterase class II)
MRSESLVQRHARHLVHTLHVAIQALKLYPLENERVQRSISELHRVTTGVLDTEGALELRASGDFFYLNEVRLRTDLGTYETYGSVARALARHGIGSLNVVAGVAEAEWVAFLSLLLEPTEEKDAFKAFAHALTHVPMRSIRVTEARAVLPAGEEGEDERVRLARRTYVESVRVLDELVTELRESGAVNARKTKRAVQNLVDRVLLDETSMLAMTTLRDFDEYVLTHAVNTCLFSLVIGKKLGLHKAELFELGLAAVFADLGMTTLPPELLRREELTPEEWDQIRSHPRRGLRALFHVGGFSRRPYRAMLAAYEHHMGVDGSGYPEAVREREPTLVSRIVAVADAFDAALSKRSYRYAPKPPDRILLEMKDDPHWGMDPLVTKVFIGALGVYPVGTLLLLDTGELAVVASRNPEPEAVWRPIVRIVTDREGRPLPEPVTADLVESHPVSGRPLRTVERALEARRYGVDAGAYFL